MRLPQVTPQVISGSPFATIQKGSNMPRIIDMEIEAPLSEAALRVQEIGKGRREGVDGRRRRSPRVRVQLRAELPENPLEQEREGIRHEQEEE